MGFLKSLFGSGDSAPKRTPESDLSNATMITVPQHLIIEPFSKINYWDLPGNQGRRVRAYFLMERPIEGAQTGLAIDGSGSMQGAFGHEHMVAGRQATANELKELIRLGYARVRGGQFEVVNGPAAMEMFARWGILQQVPGGANIVEAQAREMTAYLSKFDADGGTTVIYWATGDGRRIEVVGDLRKEDCPTALFPGPTDFGQDTHLTPAIEYFVERFKDAEWGIYVFISDGQLKDLDSVKRLSTKLAREIAAKKRNNLKFVLIGVGDEIDEGQMEELDDLDTGTDLDLWDHKIATEMKQLAEIFAEVVSETVIVIKNDGLIKDSVGSIVQDYRDSGLPALMWFTLPPNDKMFTLEVAGQRVTQVLEEGVVVPSEEPPKPPAQQAPAQQDRPPTPAQASPPPSAAAIVGAGPVAEREPAPAAPQEPAATVEKSPAPPPDTGGASNLSVAPNTLDFGNFSAWKKEPLPSLSAQLHNGGATNWQGSVRSNVPWLEVNPTSVACPAGGNVEIQVTLSSNGSSLAARKFVANDAIIFEGEGVYLTLEAQIDTRK